LTTLNLNFWANNIGDEGAAKINECLSKLTNLTHLDLNFRYNQIGAEGAS
jgi:hypothetical protein